LKLPHDALLHACSPDVLPALAAQVEQLHNALLDGCERFREDMGEVTDNVSLATALETLWAERLQTAAASGGGGLLLWASVSSAHCSPSFLCWLSSACMNRLPLPMPSGCVRHDGCCIAGLKPLM
jgi:hypothetical protein